MDVYFPSKEEIDKALAQNGVKNKVEWQQNILKGMNGVLKSDPVRYRAYGPYWWEIKNMLAEAGFEFDDFEKPLDLNLFDENYLYLAAGVLLAMDWVDNYFGENKFELHSGQEESTCYVLEDSDMERRAFSTLALS